MQSDVHTAAAPQRTHILTVALGLGSFGLGLVLSIVTGAGFFDIALQVFGLYTLLTWWFKTYELHPEELIVRDGVLQRRTRVVPYRRVQQIDVRRSLLMQVFGLAELRIETAGSREGTVNLALLDVRVADGLREHVLRRRAASHSSGTSGSVAEAGASAAAATAVAYPLLEIGGGQLVLAAVTATTPIVLLAIAGAIALPSIALAVAVDPVWISLAIGMLVFGAIAALVTLVAYVLNYAGYRLDVAGDELQLSYGLLEKQHVHVPRARVQHVVIVDNPVQRALGLVSMHVRSAASVTSAGGISGRVDIPIVRRDALPLLLPHVLGDVTASTPSLTPRPPAARRRGIVRRVAVLVVPATVALVVSPPIGVLAIAVAAGAGYLWGRAAHALAGYAAAPPVAAFAAGVFRHELHLVPVRRVQSARTRQSPFQRRSKLGTILLDIAGTRTAPSLYDGDETIARDIRRRVPLATAPSTNVPGDPVAG
jgi:putative membrane protein